MPPEQLAGQDVDARTDVFAFGVVAWELATGVHPLGASAAELMGRMADLLDGKTMTPVGPPLPLAGLEPILRRSLRRNAAERYRSAEFILPDLQSLRLTGAAPAVASVQPASARTPLWWWQFHQAIIAVVIAAMPVAVWFVREADRTTGIRLFLAVLALSTVSVTIRLNLLFTSRVNLPHLGAQRARVYRPMAIVEALLGVLLLIAAAFVAGAQRRAGLRAGNARRRHRGVARRHRAGDDGGGGDRGALTRAGRRPASNVAPHRRRGPASPTPAQRRWMPLAPPQTPAPRSKTPAPHPRIVRRGLQTPASISSIILISAWGSTGFATWRWKPTDSACSRSPGAANADSAMRTRGAWSPSSRVSARMNA